MPSPASQLPKTLFFTTLALIAFAANSVLCRLALGEQAIDAAGFTAIRLVSGIIVLLIILQTRPQTTSVAGKGSWMAGLMLFVYAAAFSFAYISLDTGTGALILFGSVQLTMILLSLLAGNRLLLLEWLGLLLAAAGFVYLILPGVSAPPLGGFVLMTVAGMAWGVYTLKGRSSSNPLADTAWNFTRTLPLIILLALVALPSLQLSPKGVLLAVLSGGIASGIGYTLWYTALRGLTAIQAGVVQLLVPIIAALGGVVFVSEQMTLRLIIASILVLGGILSVVLGRHYRAQPAASRAR